MAGWVEVTGNGEAFDKDTLPTREPITAWNMQHRHNNKDPSHPQQLSPGMHTSTRNINYTRGTSSKKDAPQWHTHTYIYPTIPAHSATQVCTGVSLCTLHLHAIQVRAVGDSRLCCTCVVCFKRWLAPLCVDSAQALWASFCFRLKIILTAVKPITITNAFRVADTCVYGVKKYLKKNKKKILHECCANDLRTKTTDHFLLCWYLIHHTQRNIMAVLTYMI